MNSGEYIYICVYICILRSKWEDHRIRSCQVHLLRVQDLRFSKVTACALLGLASFRSLQVGFWQARTAPC